MARKKLKAQASDNKPCKRDRSRENFLGGGGGGIRGSYKSEHAAVAGWCTRVRELEAGSLGHLPERWEDGWVLAVKRMPSWKAPGPDKTHGWNHRDFPKANSPLKSMILGIMDGAETMPDWMVREKTVLIPKDGCIGNAYQFRPIVCLNTSYKLLTGALAATLSEHIFCSGILLSEQKALRKGRGLDGVVWRGVWMGWGIFFDAVGDWMGWGGWRG